MELHEYQQIMLRDYFEGCRETLVLIGKKNGKSTLLGALALYHLCTTPDAECVIAAASRDQAQIMLRQAQGFIRRSPWLQERLLVKQREIVHRRFGGRIRVLASDVDTADGVIPTLALVDELHRHKSADLYGLFRDGLGPRQGQMITISTAGGDEESPLGQLRAKARGMAGLKREGTYLHVHSNGFAMHEWALEPSDDRDDLELVKLANPAPWQTTAELRKRYESPSMTPWQWARFACGVWLQGEDTAIDPLEWAACASDGSTSPSEGTTVRLGVDVGWKVDCTAIVPHWIEDEIAYLGLPTVLRPAREGASLRKSEILKALEAMRDLYGVEEIVIDPENDGEVLAQDLEDIGFDVIAHSQKPAPMALAAERFSAAVREGKLRHPADQILTRHVLNAHAKSTEDGRWRFVKENKQSSKHIDALIAAAMVHSIAIAEDQDSNPFVFSVISS